MRHRRIEFITASPLQLSDRLLSRPCVPMRLREASQCDESSLVRSPAIRCCWQFQWPTPAQAKSKSTVASSTKRASPWLRNGRLQLAGQRFAHGSRRQGPRSHERRERPALLESSSTPTETSSRATRPHWRRNSARKRELFAERHRGPAWPHSRRNCEWRGALYLTAISGVSTGTWPRCKESTAAITIPDVKSVRSIG